VGFAFFRDLRGPNAPLTANWPPFSQQAHEATAVRDTERVQEIEVEIDRLAAELRGLTEGELGEMRLSKAQSVQRRE
jgi:hypothetical protein